MAKIKLPFELERPSSTEWAVDSSAVGYDATRSVRDVLDENLQELITDPEIDIIIEEIFLEGGAGDVAVGINAIAMTKSEYDALESYDPNTLYVITDVN